LLGRIANAGVLLSLIRRRTNVSTFEDALLDDDFHFGALVRHCGETELAGHYAGIAE